MRRTFAPPLRCGRRRAAATAACRTAALALALSASGCMVLPRTTTAYDPGCRIHTRQVTLEAVPIGGIVLNCSSTPASCTAGLVMAGVVTSASIVVSGSIAIVGNVVYWIERQGRCAADAPPRAG